MKSYEIQVAARHLNRLFEKASGRSLVKMLTELITNSDDSYKRIETRDPTNKDVKSIQIIADKRKRLTVVIDNAEGLTEDEMEKKFKTYGEDSGDAAEGYATRSLFGKGLRDVVFSQERATVKSIKNGNLAVAKFIKKDGRPWIVSNTQKNINRRTRKALDIPENGTRVEVKFFKDILIPDHEDLCAKVRNFYMLRTINTNPLRKVTVQTITKNTDEITEIKFNTPKYFHSETHEKIFTFDKTELPINLEIILAEGELTQEEAGLEDRVGGILIVDENDNVFDITLFKYDKNTYASHIFGKLKIIGAGEYLRKKLNQPRPEEYLSDTRDGFNKRKKFYRDLAKLIEPILEPIILTEEKRLRTITGDYSDATKAKLDEAMKVVNQLYEELVGKAESEGSLIGHDLKKPEYIAFSRNELSITEKKETPLAVLINLDTVPDGTLVTLRSDSNEICIDTNQFNVEKSKAKEGLQIKIVRIKGTTAGQSTTIFAEALSHVAKCEINVIKQDMFYPVTGMEFKPISITLYDERKRDLRLYVDDEKIPQGSNIDVYVDDPNFELTERKVVTSIENKISPTVSLYLIPIKGKGIGNTGLVSAVYDDYVANAAVEVIDKKKRTSKTKKGARFKDPVFKKIHLKRQTFLQNDGEIIINLNNRLNLLYFGEEDPYGNVDKYLHCQTRLADLVLDECLFDIVNKAWGTKLEKKYPDEPATDIRNYVEEKKFELGPKFHNIFIDKHLLRESIADNELKVVKKTDS